MEHLAALSEAFGVSGDEKAVRKIVLEQIREHVTDLYIDSIGNITARQAATEDNPLKVMLAAHMDEVGFMVTGYDSNGLIRFTSVGGIDDRILPGLRVRIVPDAVPGVITWAPIHMNHDQNVKKMKDLRIDIGLNSKSAAEGAAKRGERIAFDSHYAEIGQTMVRGKAFDDRVGVSLLIDLLKSGPYPVEILAAFTVQEEIGLRGASVAAQRLQPDMALVLEGTTAHDVPNPEANPDDPTEPNPACRVGSGPVLTVMDRSMIVPPHLLNFLRETAGKNDIPYQLKTALGGGTDGGSIHLSNGGIPTAVIAMPCRYIHSPTAFLSREDYQHMFALLQVALGTLTPELIALS